MEKRLTLGDILGYVDGWICVRPVGFHQYITQGFCEDFVSDDELLKREIAHMWAVRDRTIIVVL